MKTECMVSGFKPMEIHDGDGLRTTVFFKGCSLKCIWCHNPEGIAFEKQLAYFRSKCILCGSCVSVCPEKAISMEKGAWQLDRTRCSVCMECSKICPTEALVGYGETWTLEALEQRLLQDCVFYENSGGGVTFSGGECMMQAEPVTELAKRLYDRGIRVNIDTCGYVRQEVLEKIIPYVDTFLYDIKAVDPQVHKRCTGHANGQILENLRYLSEKGCRMEIRYPLVMGYNDGECEKIGQLLKDMPGIQKVKVLKYHDFAGSRYQALGMENTLPDTVTTWEDVARAEALLERFGLPIERNNA